MNFQTSRPFHIQAYIEDNICTFIQDRSVYGGVLCGFSPSIEAIWLLVICLSSSIFKYLLNVAIDFI